MHPAVGPLDVDAVRAAFLAEISRASFIDAYMAQVWERMGTVAIVREPPIATGAGKVLPFYLVRQDAKRVTRDAGV